MLGLPGSTSADRVVAKPPVVDLSHLGQEENTKKAEPMQGFWLKN